MRRLLVLFAASVLGAAPVHAQSLAAPAPADSGHSERLFTRRDAFVAGGFLAGAILLAPLDRERLARLVFEAERRLLAERRRRLT